MCVVNDSNPRRRHRPAYLAPARLTRPTAPQTGTLIRNDGEDGDVTNAEMTGRNNNIDDDDGTTTDNMFPPTFDMIRMAQHQQQQQPQVSTNNNNSSTDMEQCSCRKMLSSIYLGLIDCIILSMVMIMSFFFYDVEITIIKSHPQRHQRSTNSNTNSSRFQRRQQPQQPHPDEISGSRIVWRRTEPPSGRMTPRSTTSSDTTTTATETSRDTDGTTSMGDRSGSTTTSSSLPHPRSNPILPFLSLSSSTTTTTTRRGFQDSIV